MKVLASLKSAAQKRAAYRRALAEIDALPSKIKADLEFDNGRAAHVVRSAIYG